MKRIPTRHARPAPAASVKVPSAQRDPRAPTDVFVSYAHEDEARLRPLVMALDRQWTVFWDRTIPFGRHYRSHIAPVLEEARCVLVVWSGHSVTSDSVIEEAGEGRRRGCLVPIRIDAVDPPFGFRELQYGDFAEVGFVRSPRLQALLSTVAAVVSPVVAKPVMEGRVVKRSSRTPERKPKARRQPSSGQVVELGEVRLPKSDPRAVGFWDGSKGPREISVHVRFAVPFARTPNVIASLREIDLGDVGANIHRISVRAENVGREGFDLYFATWLESQVYGAVASWIAVGDRR
jgi:hypothetical protein